MFVAIKSINGHAYEYNNKRVVLKGGCYLNEISKEDFKELCEYYPDINRLIDEGFYITSDTNDKNKERKASEDTLQSTKDKQDKAMAINERNTRAKIVRN